VFAEMTLGVPLRVQTLYVALVNVVPQTAERGE
jgi:hypothetical protein